MNRSNLEHASATIDGEPTLEELQQKLVDTRANWARYQAARETSRKDKITDNYVSAKMEYDATLIAVQKAELSELLNELEHPEDKALLLAEYYLHEQKTLRAAKDSYVETRYEESKVLRFRKAFSAFMSRGNTATRVAKQVALGMTGGVVVATAVTAGAGAIGVASGVVAAVTTVRAASNMARSYYSNERQGVGDIATRAEDIAISAADGAEMHDDEISRRTLERSHAVYDQDVALIQKRVRMMGTQAALSTAFGVGVGTVLGAAVHGFGGTAAHAGEIQSNELVHPGIQTQELHSPGMEVPTELQNDTSLVTPGMEQSPMVENILTHPGMAVESQPLEAPGMTIDSNTHTYNPGMEVPVDSSPELIQPGMEVPAETTTDVTSPGMEVKSSDLIHPGMEVPAEPSSDGAGNGFVVEQDNGYTHELIDAAEENGVTMSPEQALANHEAIVDTLGTTDYIDLENYDGADTYSLGDTAYETGISAPGEATWSSDAQPLIADAIDDGEINGSTSDMVQPEGTPTPTPEPEVEPEAEPEVQPEPETEPTPEDVFTAEDWREIKILLETAADNDLLEQASSNDAARGLMDDLGPRLDGMTYSDGMPVVTTDAMGNWVFNDSSEDLPDSVLRSIRQYLENNDRAAERAQELVKVIQ